MSSSAAATVPPAEPPEAFDQRPAPPPAAPFAFSADVAGEDHLGRAATARLLADLAEHPDAGTPFLIAVHGSPGSGKSSLLDQILDRLRDPGRHAASATRTLAIRVDASSGGDPAASLVSGLVAALRSDDPDLADEAILAGGDPVKAARTASNRVADLRRQLDTERQALDDIAGRQARLIDTVLFNSPGSRVDHYARAHRGAIEGRLRAFGLPSSDPVATYKDLVRETVESEGGASRFGMAMRALWGFKGQGTLIGLAVLLFGLGWVSTDLNDNQEAWVSWINGFGDRFTGVAAWAQDHAGWLAPISHTAYALAALAILVAIIRAFRFIQPVMRGASLLNGELDGRRRDLDGLLAHQTRRVDHVASEVEEAVRAAETAERRVETRRAAGVLDQAFAPGEGEFGAPASPHRSAEAFLAGLGAGLITRAAAGRRRIVVALDELDRLPASAAAAYIDTAHRLLRRTGFVTFVAVDRPHVLDGFSETDPAQASARLSRCVQLSYDLDAEVVASTSLAARPAIAAAGPSGLDRPWQDLDARLLRDLSAFAGSTPRSIKRFVNSYRVARADPKMAGATPAETAGLALALALDESGSAADLATALVAGGRVVSGEARSELDPVIAAAHSAVGRPFSAIEARRGLLVARIYSRRG